MYLKRTLENQILQASKAFPVVLISGPRQVGKTTILKNIEIDSRTYVTLDNPMLRALAQDEPEIFLQRFKRPILIDEIQYASQLFPYIKMEVDENKKPGDFWLTGSQQFHLMKNVSESLAGRVAILRLQGLSDFEANKHPQIEPFIPEYDYLLNLSNNMKPQKLPQIYEKIWRGSFPLLLTNKNTDRNTFYDSYIQTYLQRDVRDLTKVGDEKAFVKFLRATAARTGQLVNYADIARDADISANTAKAWISILETSGLIYLLEPYYNNRTKRLIKAPKLYFMDTGLCSYLTQWPTPESLEAGAMSGNILETYIMCELLKTYWHNGKQPPFYFYRDKDQKEIDLLIEQGGKIYPIEFKKTSNPDKKAVSNFKTLEKLNVIIGEGAVICLASEFIPMSRDVNIVPVWSI
jgi:uncharacterized protein